MARALWKGAISFSLIHIPVQLYTATRARELELDMLDKRDFSPVGYSRFNKATGKPVEWKNIVKGYEYEKGEYVALSAEDFRRANVEATQTIDIHAFTAREAVAPYYYETPYYLAPDRNGEKVFGLLHDALLESEKLAVASVVIRTRQRLCALLPLDDLLLLNTLRYAEELIPVSQIHSGTRGKVGKRGNGRTTRTVAVSPRELQMALKLIGEMTEPWKPEQYHDTYRDDLMKRIEEKIAAGQEHVLAQAAARPRARGGKVVDLMALLKESLEETSKPQAGRDRPAGRRSSYGRRRASRTRGRRTARRA